MKKSIKYDDWLKEKFEKDPELEKEYNSLQEKKMEERTLVYLKDRDTGIRVLLATVAMDSDSHECQLRANLRVYADLTAFFNSRDEYISGTQFTIEYELLDRVELNKSKDIVRKITKTEMISEKTAEGDKTSESYEVPAHQPDPNKCDPRVIEGEEGIYGYNGCGSTKKKPGPKPKIKTELVPCAICSKGFVRNKHDLKKMYCKNCAEISATNKLYTYTCNKCKKSFETAIEFTNDKRYIRSLRCPDCAFKKIFEATNKKPKIKGKEGSKK